MIDSFHRVLAVEETGRGKITPSRRSDRDSTKRKNWGFDHIPVEIGRRQEVRVKFPPQCRLKIRWKWLQIVQSVVCRCIPGSQPTCGQFIIVAWFNPSIVISSGMLFRDLSHPNDLWTVRYLKRVAIRTGWVRLERFEYLMKLSLDGGCGCRGAGQRGFDEWIGWLWQIIRSKDQIPVADGWDNLIRFMIWLGVVWGNCEVINLLIEFDWKHQSCWLYSAGMISWDDENR